MWLTYIAVVLVIAAIAATVAGGGIFTIVLIPLAVIAIGVAVYSSAGARAAGMKGRGKRSPDSRPTPASALPHSRGGSSGRVATTPDDLVQARQREQ